MVLKQVFTIIALCNGLGNAWFRPPKCSYLVCTGYDWRDDWSPSVSQGKCVMQARKGHPLYKRQTASFACPPTMPCAFKMQARKMCEYGIFLFGYDCGMILVLIWILRTFLRGIRKEPCYVLADVLNGGILLIIIEILKKKGFVVHKIDIFNLFVCHTGWNMLFLDRCMDGCMHACMHAWMDEWMVGEDAWMHGCMGV